MLVVVVLVMVMNLSGRQLVRLASQGTFLGNAGSGNKAEKKALPVWILKNKSLSLQLFHHEAKMVVNK